MLMIGCHLSSSKGFYYMGYGEGGVHMIADLLNQIIQPEQTTTILLETMSGKGSEVGRNFQEQQAILERVEADDHQSSGAPRAAVLSGDT